MQWVGHRATGRARCAPLPSQCGNVALRALKMLPCPACLRPQNANLLATGKRPPLSPQEGWISDGRQVLHFNPVCYSRYSQAVELTSGELIPSQAPLLK